MLHDSGLIIPSCFCVRLKVSIIKNKFYDTLKFYSILNISKINI